MMGSIDVKSSSGTYKYSVGRSILRNRLSELNQTRSFTSGFLFVDENVWQHHDERIVEDFKACGIDTQVQIIPAGEKSKSVREWESLVDYLLRSGVRRNTPLFAIGGGVTGDLAGFVAASTMRGIPLIHIPTTLLAMVDSSIGGKTGVNHETGKNLIGAFYQPNEVIAEIDFLDTLPAREWTNGLSEVLKYGAIRDKDIFTRSELFLKKEVNPSEQSELQSLILDCAKIKADIVQEDEFEAGTRAYLNFGHTFAHAMEKAADFNLLNHGEAVYLGMLAATKLSNLVGADLDSAAFERFRDLYTFKVSADMLRVDAMMKTMKLDKKVIDENYRFILLKDWQQPEVKTVNNEELIRQAWLTVHKQLS